VAIGQAILPASTLDTSWQHVDGSFVWNFDQKPASKIRFQIYINDKSALYSADEAYVVPSI